MTNELGIDRSGNNNTWTVNNMTLAADQVVDSPTNNFCTLNPVTLNAGDTHNSGGVAVLTEGNLTWDSVASQTTYFSGASTFSMLTGKWYAEVRCDVHDGTGAFSPGIIFNFSENYKNHAQPGEFAFSWGYHSSGLVAVNNSALAGTYASFTVGDIIGIAVDLDNDKFYVAKNNTWQEQNPSGGSGLSLSAYAGKEAVFACGATNANRKSGTWNFGQDSSFAGEETAQGNQDSNDIGDFYYTPPSGFLALCTSNLPAVAVTPSEHFNTILYTGDGTGTQAQTGVGFEPDMIWVKSRNAANYHGIADQVRGVDKFLYPNDNLAEETNSTDYINSFDSDGFTHGSNGTVGQNTITYVAWNWKANGSGSSNTVGDLDSTVSVNADAGFSIVSYTGDGSSPATIGHGLSKAPELIHIKNRTDVDSWISFTTVIDGSLDYMYLNLTNAKANLGIATPTSTVFSVDDGNQINGSGDAHIAYCFHSVDGYSKVGSYTGNGNADGTFVYTGFTPAFVIIKKTSNTGVWWMIDNKRETSNPREFGLQANDSAVELSVSKPFDMVSNGFKTRAASGYFNDAETYIYLAFAETPFKYSNAR